MTDNINSFSIRIEVWVFIEHTWYLYINNGQVVIYVLQYDLTVQ